MGVGRGNLGNARIEKFLFVWMSSLGGLEFVFSFAFAFLLFASKLVEKLQ